MCSRSDLVTRVLAVLGIVLGVVGVLLSLNGCADLCATVGATRCAGEAQEVCAGDGRWAMVRDCADVVDTVGGAWTCCVGDDAGPECWPVEDCPQ
jgi:hypothetical protein